MIEFIDEDSLPPLPPLTCDKCESVISHNGSIEGDCWAGNCVVLLCRTCNHEWASWGPIKCPCQSRHPKLRRIRHMYARRRR